MAPAGGVGQVFLCLQQLSHMSSAPNNNNTLVLQFKAGQDYEMTESETSYTREFPISPPFPHIRPHQLVLSHLGALRNAESPTSLGNMRIKVV